MLVRIAGVTLDSKKNIQFALTAVKGIGVTRSKEILSHFNIDRHAKFDDLDEKTIIDIRNYIENEYLVEENLVRSVKSNIKRLKDISAWRGLRHAVGLPVRGQTTKTNSRTRRGNKRLTGGSGKVKASKK